MSCDEEEGAEPPAASDAASEEQTAANAEPHADHACPGCKRSFASKTALGAHMARWCKTPVPAAASSVQQARAEAGPPLDHECPGCKRSFASQPALGTHMACWCTEVAHSLNVTCTEDDGVLLLSVTKFSSKATGGALMGQIDWDNVAAATHTAGENATAAAVDDVYGKLPRFYTCEGGCGITGSYAAMLEHEPTCSRAAAVLPIVIPNKRVRIAPGLCPPHSRASFAPALVFCSRMCLIGAPCHIPTATDARSGEGPRAHR
jgi:hypothetical protein